MYLYLIRHAQSQNNAAPDHLRVEDPAITQVGEQQAHQLGPALRFLQLDRIYTSAFLRSLLTTSIAARYLDVPIEVDRDLHERGGVFRGWGDGAREGGPGLTPAEIARQFPHFKPDPRITDAGWWGMQPRETDDEAVARARRLLHHTAAQFADGQRIAWLMHADFIRCLLSVIIGGDWQQLHFGPIANTAITRLSRNGAGWQIDYFNDTSHLPESLWT